MFILCVGGDALNACVSVFTFTLNFSYTNEMALYNFTLALTWPKLYIQGDVYGNNTRTHMKPVH